MMLLIDYLPGGYCWLITVSNSGVSPQAKLLVTTAMIKIKPTCNCEPNC